MFFMRFLGCVTGGFIIKILIAKFTTQFLTIGINILIFVVLNMANISLSKYWLGLIIFIASMAFIGMTVIVYGLLFKLFQSNAADKMQIMAFMFGVGAMIGPLFVILFKIRTFQILGISHLISIVIFWYYPLPDLDKSSNNSE